MISCDLCHGQGKPNIFCECVKPGYAIELQLYLTLGFRKTPCQAKEAKLRNRAPWEHEKAVFWREEAWWSNWFASVGRGPGSRGNRISQKGFLFFQEDLKVANINGTLKNTERETKSMRLRRWIWWNPQRPFGTLLAQIRCRIWEGGSETSWVS